jgi:hypothetical protein
LAECQICQDYDDRLSEKVAHELLDEIAREEGYWRVFHAKPNSKKDRQGKDFCVVTQKGVRAIHIQVKKFRVLEPEVLKRRLNGMRELPRRRKNRKRQLDTVQKLREYVFETLREYKKLNLLINDREIRDEFYKTTQRINLFRALHKEQNYQKLLEIYGEIEPYIAIFQRAIFHAQNYPSVKLFFIVQFEDEQGRPAHLAQTKADWKALIKKLLSERV